MAGADANGVSLIYPGSKRRRGLAPLRCPDIHALVRSLSGRFQAQPRRGPFPVSAAHRESARNEETRGARIAIAVEHHDQEQILRSARGSRAPVRRRPSLAVAHCLRSRSAPRDPRRQPPQRDGDRRRHRSRIADAGRKDRCPLHDRVPDVGPCRRRAHGELRRGEGRAPGGAGRARRKLFPAPGDRQQARGVSPAVGRRARAVERRPPQR